MPDVVIVGGGIIGAACAHELAGRGLEATLVERSELAAGASGRNHGLLLVPTDPALVPMFEASLTTYRDKVAEAPVPFSLDDDPIGFLIVAADDDAEREAAQDEAAAVSRSGVAVERLEGGALRRVEPGLSNEMIDGWLLDDGRRLDPAALTVSLALLAGAAGAEIRLHETVRSLIARGDGVRGVVTDQGPIEADTILLAAGPWSATLARAVGIRLPIAGARGWLVRLDPSGAVVRRVVERAGWHGVSGEDALPPMSAAEVARAFPSPDVGSLLQPNADGTMLVGGSRQRAVTHEPEDPSVPRELLRRAADVAPAVAEAGVLGAWWGVRPMTPDGAPLVGRVSPGLIVATGHGSQGVTLGGGTAALVASMIAEERPPFDPSPFDPSRIV